jgi:hypothetical protein
LNKELSNICKQAQFSYVTMVSGLYEKEDVSTGSEIRKGNDSKPIDLMENLP